MKDFFKYLASSSSDKEWGLYLTVAGRYHALAGTPYPATDHPTGYYFSWEKGRILNEFQLNYISEGEGTLETDDNSYRIEPGTMIIISPGMKHRYRPNPRTGWVETYVGFNGGLAKHFVQQVFQGVAQPVIYCGLKMEILDTYQRVLDLVSEQKPGYQHITSGLIIEMLGSLVSFQTQSNLDGKAVDPLINQAKTYMWEKVQDNIDLKRFAREHSVSYSYFRKVFKLYTGISPHQYYLDLKMMRAKEILLSTDKSIKEVTYLLGFDSIHYFSRLFKQKTGSPPSSYRS